MPEGQGYNLVGPNGERVNVTADGLAAAIDSGFSLETAAEGAARASEQGRGELAEERYGGIGGAVEAGIQGGLRGATFGLSDVVQTALGDGATRERLAGLKSVNPTVSAVSEIGGAIAPAILSGGAGAAGTAARLTPAGRAAALGERVMKIGADKGLAAKVATAGLGAGLEGAAQNVGSYLSDVALGNKKLSAEGALGAGLDGAMWGAAAGGALAISEKGLRSARKLFADADVTPATVARVEQEAAATVDGALAEADEASAQLKTKVRNVRKARAEVDPDAAAHEARVRAERLAQEQAKTEGQQALARQRGARADDAELRLERAKAKGELPARGKKSPAEEVAAPPAPAPTPDESLEALLGQTAKELEGGASIGALNAQARTPRQVAEDAIEDALDDAAAKVDPDAAHLHGLRKELDEARAGVARFNPRDYAKNLRKGGPSSVNVPTKGVISNALDAEGRAVVAGLDNEARYTNTVTAKHYDAAGNQVDSAIRPDESVMFDRPRPLEPDRLAQELGAAGPVRPAQAKGIGTSVGDLVRNDYDALIRRAARSADDAEREALIREAAELESRAFDVSPPEVTEAAMGARLRKGTSGPELARRRVAREVAALEKEARKGPIRQLTDEVLGADDALTDMEAMIMAYRRYENAELAVAKALGPEAPAGMAQRAAAHEEAQLARQGAEQAQAAQQAEEIAKYTAPEQAADVAARAGETAAGVSGSAPAAQAGGVGGMVADALTALEVLGSVGVPGLPRPESIPVIGPMLGIVLKARAAAKVWSKLGGKIPATAEGEIAKRAAATRNRIRGAVRDMLDAGSAVVTKAQRPAPIAAVLASKLFEAGPPPEKRKRQGAPESDVARLFSARADEVVRSQAIGAIPRAVDARLNVADAEVRQAVIDATMRKMSFLASKLPGGGLLPAPVPTDDPDWIPDRASIETFARYVEAANDPAGVLERALDGHLSLEGVETLQNVFPELYAEAQLALLERATEISATVPYRRRTELSVLFNVPLDGTMAPDYFAAAQRSYQEQAPQQSTGAAPAAPPTPSISAPVNIGERAKMPLDRISQR